MTGWLSVKLSSVWGTMDVRACTAVCCTLACSESTLGDFMKLTCPKIASFKLLTSTAVWVKRSRFYLAFFFPPHAGHILLLCLHVDRMILFQEIAVSLL